ncbi:MAG: DUF4194 domain-containing protein [Tissierellia bacterium]|nr:DUF4194 domain-containing protein [Patescibacteria group bacterium]MDD4677727.1 DUF4194 domain-containing protein [Tissierellia bacterium]
MMEILKESSVQKDKFKIAANKLLNNCFILKKKDDTRNDYIFIVQNKELFIEYFELLGYTIEINEMYGVVALSNMYGTGRLRLKKIESVVLLILRLLYIEKRKELSLNEDVVILADDIHQKYDMLKIESKLNIDKTMLRDAVRLFKRYNLIYNIDADVTKSNARIRIYPSILFAVTNENVTQMYEAINDKLDKYINGGDSDNYEEANDEDIMQD